MTNQERNDYMTILKDPSGMDNGSGNELDLHTGVRGEGQKEYLLGLIVVRILQEQKELKTQIEKLKGELRRKAKKEALKESIEEEASKEAEKPNKKSLFAKKKKRKEVAR